MPCLLYLFMNNVASLLVWSTLWYSTHIMVVVGVRVLEVQGAAGQAAIVAVLVSGGEQAAVGVFVVEVMAPLG